MKSLVLTISAAVILVTGVGAASAQTPPATVDGLIGAAKNAAGLDWAGTFLRLCIPPPPPAPAAAGARGRGAAASPPARETWYAEPAKVADNLYFLGNVEAGIDKLASDPDACDSGRTAVAT